MTSNPLIALLTDFGLDDAYVGTMKGVMLSICPQARLVDLTHAIQPQNVRQAAYVLSTSFRHFPPETVFLVVVDPGVGTARQPMAVATDHGTYVAPNNGVLSYVMNHLTASHSAVLQDAAYRLPGVSMTFHGRDIFAPAAAHLAAGVPITELGPTLPEMIKLDDPRLTLGDASIEGEVLHIDHFGNVITSISVLTWETSETLQLTPQFGDADAPPRAIEAAEARVRAGDTTLTAIRPTYGAVPPGTAVALVGSSGQLEIGVNQGSAARQLGLALGDPITLTLRR